MTSTVKLIIGETEHDLDLKKFMLSEAIALEEDWGLTTTEFAKAVASGSPPMRVVGAMVWLVQVRELAAEDGVTFGEASKLLPVASFDTDLMALRIEAPQEPENPTRGVTPTPTTRTTRATSAKKRTRTS